MSANPCRTCCTNTWDSDGVPWIDRVVATNTAAIGRAGRATLRRSTTAMLSTGSRSLGVIFHHLIRWSMWADASNIRLPWSRSPNACRASAGCHPRLGLIEHTRVPPTATEGSRRCVLNNLARSAGTTHSSRRAGTRSLCVAPGVSAGCHPRLGPNEHTLTDHVWAI